MGGRRRPRGRDVDGILLLDKPIGATSNGALQTVKHIYKAKKAGHTGSLDPLADGLLPICFGEATKMSAFLLDADKRYWLRMKLGIKTTTADAEGDIVEERDASHVSQADVEQILPQFLGKQQQLPPMYSAVKHQGQRLYKLAREGVTVEREPRDIVIHELNFLSFENGEAQLEVACSKGTYVRTLAEDIGEALGVGAFVTALRRTGVGPYTADHLLELDQLEQMMVNREFAALDELLLPVDSALGNWPKIKLTEDSVFYLKMGQPVQVPKSPTEGWVRLYDPSDKFFGVGEIADDGRIAPRRLMSS